MTLIHEAVLLVLILVSIVNGNTRIRRLAGGEDVTDGQYPYMASIKYNNNFVCAGAIISYTKILTAAECVSVCLGSEGKVYSDCLKNMSVLTGSTNLSRGGNTFQVKSIKIPDNHVTLYIFLNNLAIISLDRRISESAVEKPINLPDMDVFENSTAIVSGWGQLSEDGGVNNGLKNLTEKVISNEKCAKLFGFVTVDAKDLCAVPVSGADKAGLCNGDSGNPLVQNGKLIGISTWGKGCAEGFPDVFANIYRHLDFIYSELK